MKRTPIYTFDHHLPLDLLDPGFDLLDVDLDATLGDLMLAETGQRVVPLKPDGGL